MYRLFRCLQLLWRFYWQLQARKTSSSITIKEHLLPSILYLICEKYVKVKRFTHAFLYMYTAGSFPHEILFFINGTFYILQIIHINRL